MMLHRLAKNSVCLALAAVLSGCGATQSEPEATATPTGPGPVRLTPQREAAPTQQVYAGGVDAGELAKAVDRYRIQKKRAESAYETGAADLNGDGKPEAVVLFTGPDWCSRTGCSLVIFQAQEFGFRLVSHIVSVRPPVLSAPPQGTGWRDLIVKTGGGAAPVRAVTVAFSANGYAANAINQPQADAGVQGASIIAETPSFQAAMDRNAAGAGEAHATGGLDHAGQTRNP
jgi:hypothetical protein